MPVRVAPVLGVANERAIAVDAAPARHPLGEPAVLAAPFQAREWAGRLSGLSWPLALLKAGFATSTRNFAMSSITTVASHRPGPLARAVRRIVRLLRTLELALQVRHERRLLLAMDDHTLKDLGLHGIAYGEATRRFWDVPLDRQSAINQRRAERR
jgi:uncharacterized protein YjiS (DUF1127 family)